MTEEKDMADLASVGRETVRTFAGAEGPELSDDVYRRVGAALVAMSADSPAGIDMWNAVAAEARLPILPVLDRAPAALRLREGNGIIAMRGGKVWREPLH